MPQSNCWKELTRRIYKATRVNDWTTAEATLISERRYQDSRPPSGGESKTTFWHREGARTTPERRKRTARKRDWTTWKENWKWRDKKHELGLNFWIANAHNSVGTCNWVSGRKAEHIESFTRKTFSDGGSQLNQVETVGFANCLEWSFLTQSCCTHSNWQNQW